MCVGDGGSRGVDGWLLLLLNKYVRTVGVPVVSVSQEAEVGGSLDPRRGNLRQHSEALSQIYF